VRQSCGFVHAYFCVAKDRMLGIQFRDTLSLFIARRLDAGANGR
jgi:hypothetical protein